METEIDLNIIKLSTEIEETKVCGICKKEKPLSDFFKHKNKRLGVRFECKDCYKEETAKDRLKNPEKWKAKRHRNGLKEMYGITVEDYNCLYQAQNGCCKICGISQLKLRKKLFVDHCHKTKYIRGLLCQKCNFLIGLANDSPKHLNLAINYLTEAQQAIDKKNLHFII
jgi:hypothetical protein